MMSGAKRSGRGARGDAGDEDMNAPDPTKLNKREGKPLPPLFPVRSSLLSLTLLNISIYDAFSIKWRCIFSLQRAMTSKTGL
jgi:hypothetical protein